MISFVLEVQSSSSRSFYSGEVQAVIELIYVWIWGFYAWFFHITDEVFYFTSLEASLPVQFYRLKELLWLPPLLPWTLLLLWTMQHNLFQCALPINSLSWHMKIDPLDGLLLFVSPSWDESIYLLVFILFSLTFPLIWYLCWLQRELTMQPSAFTTFFFFMFLIWNSKYSCSHFTSLCKPCFNNHLVMLELGIFSSFNYIFKQN